MAAPKDVQTILEEVVRRINEHGRRLRLLEERSRGIETRLGTVEESILRNSDAAREDVEKISSVLKDLDTRLLKIENDIEKMAKDIAKSARRTELQEIENLLKLYSPLTSTFVTKEQVERMIKGQEE